MPWWLWVILVPFLYVAYRLLSIILSPFWPSPLHKIPGPVQTSWLNGHASEVVGFSALEPQMKWVKQFPDAPMIHYRLQGNGERVLLVHPDAVQQAIKEKNLLSKNLDLYRAFSRLIGDGLVTLLGRQHTEHRRMIQPAFRLQILKASVPVFISQTEQLCKMWRKRLGGGVDVGCDLNKLTMNIIGMSAFGFDFDSMSDEDSVGKEASAHFTAIVEGGPSSALRFLVFAFPWLIDSPLVVHKARKSIQYTDELVIQIIKEKRAQLKNMDADSHHTYNLLETVLVSGESGDLTDQQLADHVKTLMFAGHETTATFVLWCLFALTQEPEIVAKVKQELDEHITDYDSITYEKLDELVYLRAVMKEVLRMYPPASIVSRRMEEDFHYGGYTVPSGTIVTISPYVLQHNPKWWDNPETFNPTRWLGAQDLHQYQFIPFFKGSRNCIGEKFAFLEASVILSILLKEFRFEYDHKEWAATKRTTNIVMRPTPSPIMRVQLW